MNENIWFPKPRDSQVQWRLVRRFPGWQVEGWIGKQCILVHKYWFKSNAKRHLFLVVEHEKARQKKHNLEIK